MATIKNIFYALLLSFLLPVHALAQSDLDPIQSTGGAPELYGRVIKFLLGFSAVGALAFFIIGGIILLTSRGNPEKVKAGKDSIVWAIIGLFVAFTSFILLRFIIERIIAPT